MNLEPPGIGLRCVHHRCSGGSIVKLKGIVASCAVVGVAFGLAGCSSDSKSSSSTTTTPKQAVCADKTALEKSVQALSDSATISGGKSTIEAALKKVQKNLDALKGSVKADLKPQVDELKTSLDDLQSTVKGFGSGSITSNLTKAGQAISKVGTSAGSLAASLNTDCS
jgi:hypothetical protein